MTPYFDNGQIVIYCGDNVKVLKHLGRDISDLTVTSPPYDNLRLYDGYSWNFEELSGRLFYATVKGGVVVWVVADATINGSETGSSFRQALGFMKRGFKLADTMVYAVKGTGAKGSNKTYWQGFEYMFVLSKGILKTSNRIADIKNIHAGSTRAGRACVNGKPKNEPDHVDKNIGTRTNVWFYNVGYMDSSDKTAHPAPFPEALARDHIISWSNEGDTILDPFLGSGTTTKMAQLLNRKAIGIELSEDYCKIAVERLSHKVAYSIPDEIGVKRKPIQLSLV